MRKLIFTSHSLLKGQEAGSKCSFRSRSRVYGWNLRGNSADCSWPRFRRRAKSRWSIAWGDASGPQPFGVFHSYRCKPLSGYNYDSFNMDFFFLFLSYSLSTFVRLGSQHPASASGCSSQQHPDAAGRHGDVSWAGLVRACQWFHLSHLSLHGLYDPLLYSGILDGPGSPVILDKDLNFYLDQNILEMDLTFCWGCVNPWIFILCQVEGKFLIKISFKSTHPIEIFSILLWINLSIPFFFKVWSQWKLK